MQWSSSHPSFVAHNVDFFRDRMEKATPQPCPAIDPTGTNDDAIPQPLDPQELDTDQQRAFDLVVNLGLSVIVHGLPGTGKSKLARTIIARVHNIRSVFVLSAMGIVANGLGYSRNSSMQSFMGWQDDNDTVADCAKRVIRNETKRANMCARDLLVIIDEISTASAELLELFCGVCREVRASDHPCGGVQLCMLGDFGQTGPVSSDDKPIRFAFQSEKWKQLAPKTIVLKKNYSNGTTRTTAPMRQATNGYRRLRPERQSNASHGRHPTRQAPKK